MTEKKTVSMPLDEFIKEHEALIAILKRGDRKELLAEAKKQGTELKRYKKDVAKGFEATLILIRK